MGADLDGEDEARNIGALAATLEPARFEHHAAAARCGVFSDAKPCEHAGGRRCVHLPQPARVRGRRGLRAAPRGDPFRRVTPGVEALGVLAAAHQGRLGAGRRRHRGGHRAPVGAAGLGRGGRDHGLVLHRGRAGLRRRGAASSSRWARSSRPSSARPSTWSSAAGSPSRATGEGGALGARLLVGCLAFELLLDLVQLEGVELALYQLSTIDSTTRAMVIDVVTTRWRRKKPRTASTGLAMLALKIRTAITAVTVPARLQARKATGFMPVVPARAHTTAPGKRNTSGTTPWRTASR